MLWLRAWSSAGPGYALPQQAVDPGKINTQLCACFPICKMGILIPAWQGYSEDFQEHFLYNQDDVLHKTQGQQKSHFWSILNTVKSGSEPSTYQGQQEAYYWLMCAAPQNWE